MLNMRKFLFLLLLCLCGMISRSQQAAAVDSMKTGLSKATTVAEKAYWIDLLSRTLMNVSLEQADEYGKKLITLAEESRDRKLMVMAYNSNGTRCSYRAGTKDYSLRAIEYFNKALAIAKQNRMDEEIGETLLKLSSIHLAIPDKEKALNYVNQAFSIISTTNNDSLKAEAHGVFGDVYLVRNDKILALRNYLNSLRLAETINKPNLLRRCYVNLSGFYSGIEDYDRAIDYFMLGYKQLDNMKEKNVPYQRAMDLIGIGRLYAGKKNYDMAIEYYEKSVGMAEALKFSSLKVPGYTSILNQYLAMDQPRKALDYFNSAAGQNVRKYLADFDLSWAIDQGYGYIYTQLNMFDSARYYFDRATPYFDKNPNDYARLNYYAQLGTFYEKTGENQKAIDLYLKVKEIGDRTGQLESIEKSAKHLDTLYARMGNFQQASVYNSIYYKYKDSIQELNKERELTQVEATDEQQRQARLQIEAAEKKARKNNIQYMGITIGIAALFVLLVVLGMFKLPVTAIRAIGFFAFLLFFEFIFLVFKKNIYALTQGEPWKDLAFMIALAALLVPLHHWLEHKVIHYLTSHNRLTASGKGLMDKLMRRKKTTAK
jgi:tetratricopeptide (TPR) repeat protein